MKIKELPVMERPYEKLEEHGAESLSNAELLAIIIKTGTKDYTSVQIAQDLLKEDIEKKGIRFAFVNYTYGLNGLESRRTGQEYLVDMLSDTNIEETLKEAEENADITIAILHVGNEYVYEPTDYAKKQVDRFIDNGADIVLCAHPHVIEPYEKRVTDKGNKGLVYYSLGNFVSNQDELPRLLGGMADIDVKKTSNGVEIVNYNMIPLVTHQERGYFTTYKLEDYTDELCKKHKLYGKGLSINYLEDLYDKIVNREI